MLRINAKKYRLIQSTVLTVLLTVSLFIANGIAFSSDAEDGNAVMINSDTFPDASLRSCILDMYPEGEIPQSELNSKTSLDISGKGIRDLRGVELFENLQELNCSNNIIVVESINTCDMLKKLRRLDISNNTSLKYLEVSGFLTEDYWHDENYVLEELDVSGCTSLEELLCYGNLLKNLNVDGCKSLELLDCSSNKLNTLNIDDCAVLTTLDCSSNKLNTLNIDDCAVLTTLDCGFNDLKALDVSGCKKIKVLCCEKNDLKKLDIRVLPLVEKLDCKNNNLTSLKLGEKKLLSIDCSYNSLSSLDLSKVSFLNTSTASIDYADMPLSDSYGLIYCSDNNLTSLKLPENEKISFLWCFNNELTELDLSKIKLIAKIDYFPSPYLRYDKDKVKKLLLPEYSIGKLSDKVYKGNPVKYSVTSMKLKMGGYKLEKEEIKGGRFKTKYKNNNSIGLATVTIKDVNGISATQSFRIVPARAVIKSVKSAKRQLTVSVKKQPGDVKYQISVKKKGSKAAAKKYTVKKGLTRNIKRLKKNTKYTVKVRAFKRVSGNTYWGKWSKAKVVKVR